MNKAFQESHAQGIVMVKLAIMKLLLSHSVALIFKDLLLPIQYDDDSASTV